MTNTATTLTGSSSGLRAGIGAAALVAAPAAAAAEAEDRFLASLRSEDEDANYEAWSGAADVDASVIPQVSALLTAKQPNVRKGAEEALKTIVHAVGKTIDPRRLGANVGRPDAPGEMDPRQQVVMQLLSLLDGKRARVEKTTALRHLSLIATTDAVNAVTKHVHDPELREEVVFCLERIPGKASEEALLAALPEAADDFKPRILAALGHRRADEAVGACLEAMQSENPDIAMAGMKAWARIGSQTGLDLDFPELDSLAEWQQIEFQDSLLRYADAQLERVNPEEALGIYERALQRDEEHLQCAAVIGLAKVGTARAAAAIFPKLSSDSSIVRVTARQAWSSLAGGEEEG